MDDDSIFYYLLHFHSTSFLMASIFAFAEIILGSLDFLVIQNVQIVTNKMTSL